MAGTSINFKFGWYSENKNLLISEKVICILNFNHLPWRGGSGLDGSGAGIRRWKYDGGAIVVVGFSAPVSILTLDKSNPESVMLKSLTSGRYDFGVLSEVGGADDCWTEEPEAEIWKRKFR